MPDVAGCRMLTSSLLRNRGSRGQIADFARLLLLTIALFIRWT